VKLIIIANDATNHILWVKEQIFT